MTKPAHPTPFPGSTPREFELIARALIVRDQHVLTCWAPGGYAYLPGGHVEFGERAQAALARELDEELGAKVRVGPLVGVIENAFLTKKRPHHELSLVFHVELIGVGRGDEGGKGKRGRGLPPLISREAGIEFKWVPAVKIRRLDLRPTVMRPLITRLASDVESPKSPAVKWLTASPWLV